MDTVSKPCAVLFFERQILNFVLPVLTRFYGERLAVRFPVPLFSGFLCRLADVYLRLDAVRAQPVLVVVVLPPLVDCDNY